MKKTVCVIAAVAVLAVSSAYGQVSDGNLVGAVLDSSGAAVPGANVQLVNDDTGVHLTALASADGAYHFGNVVVGRYTVTASAPGFTSKSVKQVAIELNKTTTVNISLE